MEKQKVRLSTEKQLGSEHLAKSEVGWVMRSGLMESMLNIDYINSLYFILLCLELSKEGIQQEDRLSLDLGS